MGDTFVHTDEGTGLIARLSAAGSTNADPILLLHGLSGDENVMWILQSALPEESLMLAPRGLYPYADGGWSWVRDPEESGDHMRDYDSSSERLERWLPSLLREQQARSSGVVMVGFSQGAALAFALAARRHLKPKALVALSGFLPQGELAPLAHIPIFWGHGVQDEVVPFARARRDLERLHAIGAEPLLCTAEVGHKVGVECMRGLRRWLSDLHGEGP